MTPFSKFVRRYLADEPYRRLSDDDLWTTFRDHRDETAFRVFLDRCGSRIFQRCRAILNDTALAEDAFQETFIELVRHAGRLPNYPAAVAWLYQTATYKALQMSRRRRRTIRREEQVATPGAAPANAEDELAAWERHRVLADALLKLPTTQRRVIELVYLEGMTHAKVAEAIGIRRSGVGVHVRRGLDRLRQILGSTEGLTVLGAVTVEAALVAQVRPLDRGSVYRLADVAWARSAEPASLAGAWWAVGKWPAITAGLPALATAAGLAVVLDWDRAPVTPPSGARSPDTTPIVASVERESLQARNVRIVTNDLASPLRDLLQQFYTPPHRVELDGIRARGSEVEIEFRVTPPPPAATGMAARFRGRYCLVLRRLMVEGQPDGASQWYWMDSNKPIAVSIPNPFGPPLEVVCGREEFVAAAELFARLPSDVRAEPDQVRALFGVPGGEVRLPTEPRGVSGFRGGLVMATRNGALFVRNAAGQWRSAGVCPGWEPVVAGDRVYCYTHGMIRSRPLNDPTAAWEKWCDEPPLAPGDRGHRHLFVTSTQLCLTVEPHGLFTRPLADPGTGWKRVDHPMSPTGVAEADGFLFGHDGKRLFKRPMADPEAAWVPAGPWPAGNDRLFVDGDRLVSNGWGPVPIYARPMSAGPDEPWEKVGRLHDPFKP